MKTSSKEGSIDLIASNGLLPHFIARLISLFAAGSKSARIPIFARMHALKHSSRVASPLSWASQNCHVSTCQHTSVQVVNPHSNVESPDKQQCSRPKLPHFVVFKLECSWLLFAFLTLHFRRRFLPPPWQNAKRTIGTDNLRLGHHPPMTSAKCWHF